jgi:hypothetical protein
MKRRWLVATVLALGLLWVRGACGEGNEGTCVLLEDPSAPRYEFGMGYVPESRFRGYGQSAFLELDTWWAFAYFYDAVGGDVDLNLDAGLTVPVDSAGLQLPDQLGKVALDAGWTRREEFGRTWQVRAAPGVYSDLEASSLDSFFVPFSLALIQAFDPQMSGMVGLQVRLGFDRLFMPLIGIVWEPGDAFRLDARVPESRVTCFLARDASAYLGLAWRNTSYDLREKGDYDRDLITLEDFRAWAGVAWRLAYDRRMVVEFGRVFDREASFEDDAPGLASEVEIESDFFVRFALAGPL